MSPDETFVLALLRALGVAGLEAIVVGNAAAAMQGAPVTTQDVDLLVRDTPQNRAKIGTLCRELGAARPVSLGPLTRTVRLIGAAWPIDILFDAMSGELSFAAVRSRSLRVPLGDQVAVVATLADVIRSKEAAARPKDLAVLPILRDALRVLDALAADEPSP